MQVLQNKLLKRLFKWVAIPLALAFAWFQWNYPTCTFRYRLTAEVLTPEGIKTGSSVIEVSYSSTHPLPNPGRWRADTVTGEAVYVDLGHGKNLFILLGSDKWERKPSRTPGRVGGIDGIEGGDDQNIERQLGEGSLNVLWLPIEVYKLGRLPGQEREMARRVDALRSKPPVEVPILNLPLLGSFADLQKPESFDAVLPKDIGDVLGEGYVLQRVSIQIVETTLSNDIKLSIGWLERFLDRRLKKCSSDQQDGNSACEISGLQFKTENAPTDYIEY